MGIKYKIADALSRIPTNEKDSTPLDDDLPLLAIDIAQPPTDEYVYMLSTHKDRKIVLSGKCTETSSDAPPKESKVLEEYAKDTYYKATTHQVGCRENYFYLDHIGLLARKFTTDKATQDCRSEITTTTQTVHVT